jgi:hypothetical protein
LVRSAIIASATYRRLSLIVISFAVDSSLSKAAEQGTHIGRRTNLAVGLWSYSTVAEKSSLLGYWARRPACNVFGFLAF